MRERILSNPEAAVEWLGKGALDAPTSTTMLFVCELLAKLPESFAPLGRRGPMAQRKRRGSMQPTAGSAAATATTSLDTSRVPDLLSALAAIPNLVQVTWDDRS